MNLTCDWFLLYEVLFLSTRLVFNWSHNFFNASGHSHIWTKSIITYLSGMPIGQKSPWMHCRCIKEMVSDGRAILQTYLTSSIDLTSLMFHVKTIWLINLNIAILGGTAAGSLNHFQRFIIIWRIKFHGNNC